MSQILDSLPTERSEAILCYYINATSSIQIARISNISNWYFERVVFPREHLLFEALPNAQLEIYTSMSSSGILLDKISCNCLRVTEQSSSSLNTTCKEN